MTTHIARLLARDSAWIALGLLLTLAAGWRVVATPGEIIQGDLGYPFANEFWTRRFTSAWDTSYGTVLVNVMRTYTYVPWGYLVQAFDLTTEVAGKFHWLSWHVLGFLGGYFGARLVTGPETRAQHPVAIRLGLVLAGLFWALNPWTLARWEQLGVHVSGVLLPLVLGLVVSATRTQNSRARIHRALAAAAMLAFAVATSPHYMAIGLLVGLGWFAFAAVTSRGPRLPIGAAAVAFLGGTAVFAAFILIPLLVTAAAGSPTGPRYAEGTDVQPVLESGQSVIDTLTLTGHTFFGGGLKPAATALPGWRMAALIPVALLALAFWRQPSQRRVLGYAAVVGAATAFIQIASWHEGLRPGYLAVAAHAPFGWALREPDKLSGALALAYLPGLALAPATLVRIAPRRLPAVGTIQAAVLGLLLAAFMVPGIQRMLWDDRTLSLVPERFPASFRTVPEEIDRRNAAAGSRTVLAVWPLRSPEWSQHHRVLHAIETLAVTTPYATENSLVGDRLVSLIEAGPSDLADTLRAHGVSRVLVPTGTLRGRELAQALRQTDGLALELTADYYEVFRTVEPAYPWVYVTGPRGPIELPWRREGMHRLVIDLPPAGEHAHEIFTQEYWDPLWTADVPGYAATVEASERDLLRVRTEAGASGPLVLEYRLHQALLVGHAVAWAGLFAWAVWTLWPHRPRPSGPRP
ncbi:MAG: hypothetical protein OXG33_00095 [Chloroflexi bacterium]|nr:hypothetical protein [Chloroflexota bacterium]